jgi:hypothetical protein
LINRSNKANWTMARRRRLPARIPPRLEAQHVRHAPRSPARPAIAGKAAAVEPSRDVGGIGDADRDELLDQRAGGLDENEKEVPVEATLVAMTGSAGLSPGRT